MDEKNITLIDNLDIQKDDFTVKVRIIRLWSQPLFKDPQQLYSIKMILMDEEGSKIHANVLQKWISKFKKLLHEGAAIFIKNPTIARHVSKYKLIDNTNKLSLYYKTSVTKCLDFNGSLYGFSFAKYQNVISKMVPEHATVDVIGEVVACQTIVTISDEKGKPKKRMQIEIQDMESTNVYIGLKLHVTLWDAFVEQFNDYPYLSNSFNGTRLFINSEIDEIKDFRNM
ncbi:hypothetical protein OSB04_028282 [Centaurea solstitialis]|uniref:Replication protein A 70 kDa DNA-binding subunit B/D first OB fold domain-containing protein n=1 Tax=Centaurea solstitialis TaxID=347529 RepID=A0AA38WB05_9ASTR|nr:hypothetical protein OSB04_028282 [Centaurea solstitialis]